MCENKRWCYVLLFALVFFSAAALAQGQSIDGAPPPPSEVLPATSPSSTELEKILDELERIFNESEDSSEKLKLLVTELQSKLEESRTQVNAASTSLESSAKSLASSAEELTSLYRRQALELWIWRGGTIAGLVGMLVVALSR